jgi:dipeptide/tripeptide permease
MTVMNGGLLITAGMIVARFFDSDLPFLIRGITFIVLGIGFLATNLVLLRRYPKRLDSDVP